MKKPDPILWIAVAMVGLSALTCGAYLVYLFLSVILFGDPRY